ncbi:MAG: type II secretion system F family protein [Planctomycetes bacterium]|nr:type II secretion system F family protein [Planctomycetota bacterium]
MESFAYIAQDINGRRKSGRRRAVSEHEIVAWLNERGLIPVTIENADAESGKSPTLGQKRPKYADMASFCWQLATMVEGGVLITEAISTVAEDVDDSSFRETLMDISEHIQKGESFSRSASRYPKVFDRLSCSMLLAGETSGSMQTILHRMADFFSSRDQFVKKLQTALAYPIFVVVFVFGILVIMMTLIIPRFRSIFDQMGGELPAFTRAFLSVYDHIAANSGYAAIFITFIAFMLYIYGKSNEGYSRMCRLVLDLPLFGRLIRQAFLSTFCKTMATLLSAGVSIIESFDILSAMTNNYILKDAVISTKRRTIEGLSVSKAMSMNDVFPNMVSRMVQVGEKSGSLPKVLNRASAYYESKMDTTLATLLSLLGPAVIVVVGAIVLVVVIALYLPIFAMSDIH